MNNCTVSGITRTNILLSMRRLQRLLKRPKLNKSDAVEKGRVICIDSTDSEDAMLASMPEPMRLPYAQRFYTDSPLSYVCHPDDYDRLKAAMDEKYGV